MIKRKIVEITKEYDDNGTLTREVRVETEEEEESGHYHSGYGHGFISNRYYYDNTLRENTND